MAGFHWTNFFMCFAVSLGCVGFGYPSAMIAPMLSKESFLEFTGLGNADGLYRGKTALAGSLGGIFQATTIRRLFPPHLTDKSQAGAVF